MEKETILYLVTIVGCFATLAAWLSRRDSKNSTDSEWKGSINAKLDQLINSTSSIPALSELLTVTSESTKQAHKRIDEVKNDVAKLASKVESHSLK